jgi:alpha-tubulin suppressor-like RCC1 family protein
MAQTSGYKYPILNSDGTTSTTVADFADTFVRKELFLNSGVWACGYNNQGQLGLGDVISRSSPVQIGLLSNWKQISSSVQETEIFVQSHSLGISTNGSLWGWGYNDTGQLGQGTTVTVSSPIQIGPLTNWKQVMAGTHSSWAIKTDGSLWAWGRNNTNGSLGFGDLINRSSPVQVGLLTNWKQIAVEGGTAIATRTDGTLWAWGNNSNGNLGLGDIISYSSPVQVGLLSNWKEVAAGQSWALAIKTDGTLWAWGFGGYGNLGLGNLTSRSSPVQVGSLTNWKQVAVCDQTSAAIKTDGTLWTFGWNTSGQLGLGDLIYRSSPTQVGLLTNWKYVSLGYNGQVAALKTDGTLWAWGVNSNGNLGLGDALVRSSPVQVGSLTNWKQVTTGLNVMIAIQSPDLP